MTEPYLKHLKPSSDLWLLKEDTFDASRVTHFETLFTLANGYAGVRGSLEIGTSLGDPGFYIAGVYDHVDRFEHEIVNLPCWLGMRGNVEGFKIDLRKGRILKYHRFLDMYQGILFTDILWENEIRQRFRWETARLMHQVEKHCGIIYGRLTSLDASGNVQIGASLDGWMVKYGSATGRSRYTDAHTTDLQGEGISLDVVTRGTGIRVAMATRLVIQNGTGRGVTLDDDRSIETWNVKVQVNEPVYFEKHTAFYTSRDTADPAAAATAELRRIAGISSADLVQSHTAAWARKWQAADITVDGDDRAQLDLRVNLFHMLSLAQPGDNAVSIGAKGLHGNGYRGLIFWDTEVYMVPLFTYADPPVARALLQYRHRFLADAIENTKEIGYPGARYPWNSSLTGREHTWMDWQEHVGSGIAFAASRYVEATGDRDFFLKYGAELIIATAAYWAARVELDDKKGYVINKLTGPDEIHHSVNNNTYTNYIVKWHMARAVRAIAELREARAWQPLAEKYNIAEPDIARWQDISDRMYINFSSEHGFHEQFDGYFGLKEREIDRSMTKMQYTGPVQHSFKPTKVAQQVDTLLMYHLFPHAFSADVVARGYHYYDPRCSHTSTLSRSIYASVAARAGLMDEAYRQFILAAETDTGPTAECSHGIHAAAMAGAWQAAVLGFGGFSIQDGKPAFAPHLPPGWTRLAFPIRWQDATIHADIRPSQLRLTATDGHPTVTVHGTDYSLGEKETVIPLQ